MQSKQFFDNNDSTYQETVTWFEDLIYFINIIKITMER